MTDMDKFKNKYRIASARAPFWDYRRAAAYFVTICTKNRTYWFGNVLDGEMELSAMGEIVKTEWLKTFEMRPDMNLWMGEYVVMPNHFHAIIGIGNNEYNVGSRDAMHRVSTADTADTTDTINHFGPQSKNLASIVRGFKSSVTIAARQINPEFQWQSRFHDAIIRDDKSFKTISDYIVNNPILWGKDKFFKPA
jgi:putative transposase